MSITEWWWQQQQRIHKAPKRKRDFICHCFIASFSIRKDETTCWLRHRQMSSKQIIWQHAQIFPIGFYLFVFFPHLISAFFFIRVDCILRGIRCLWTIMAVRCVTQTTRVFDHNFVRQSNGFCAFRLVISTKVWWICLSFILYEEIACVTHLMPALSYMIRCCMENNKHRKVIPFE